MVGGAKTPGWSGYGMIPSVSCVVDQFAEGNTAMKAFALEGRRLVVGLILSGKGA